MPYANRYQLTKSGLAERLRQKRCALWGSSYVPWILTHEVSSKGWSTRTWSTKMQRIIHLLSRLEYLYFLRLEFFNTVREFYEQFALPLAATQEIAASLRIPHPRDPKTKVQAPMTSDFRLIRADGSQAIRSIKPQGNIEESERIRQKLLIERIYWTEMGGIADWGIITAESLTPAVNWNLEWLIDARDAGKFSKNVNEAVMLGRHLMIDEALPLEEVAEKLGQRFGGLAAGTFLLRHLLAGGHVPEAEFTVRFELYQPLPLRSEGRIS